MRVRWTMPAADDPERIKDYLSEHYSHLAHTTIRKLYDGALAPKRMPMRGRQGRRDGTREWIMHPTPYIIVYRVDQDAIEILRINHSSQQRL